MVRIRHVLFTPAIPREDYVRRCQTGLRAPSAAVRYWAVLGLSDRGRESTRADPIRDRCIQSLTPLLHDPAPVVQVAAADGLCQLGAIARALPVLVQKLEQGGPWIRLQAAIALDELDERAGPAAATLEKALNDKQNPYVARVAERALQTLQGQEAPGQQE